MELDGQTAKVWIGGPSGGPLVVKHTALEAAAGLIPFINIKGLGASKNVDVDVFAVGTNGRV